MEGYQRRDCRPGARDYILVLPSVVCSGLVAERLGGAGAVALTHQHGCLHVGDDLTHTADLLTGLACNPNVAATLVVSLGCETLRARDLTEAIVARGRPAELVVIQSSGGTEGATERGREAVARLRDEHTGGSRRTVAPDAVTFGLDVFDDSLAEDLSMEAAARGIAVSRLPDVDGGAAHSELAALGAQVIISQVAEEQAPVGFPLCPVIAIPGPGALHTALAPDFDFSPPNGDGYDSRRIIDRAEDVFNGSQTQAEARGSREFFLPRRAVTM